MEIIHQMLDMMKPVRDRLGGIKVDEQDLKRAKAAELLTLPLDVSGKNCGTCDYMGQDGRCKNKALSGLRVNDRQGCKHWYNMNVLESWKEQEGQNR